jgi:hypothetical protein
MTNNRVRVEMFEGTNPERLSNNLNEFLEANDIEVVDLKYSTSPWAHGTKHFVLLMYKER